jgi:hypothetical protein
VFIIFAESVNEIDSVIWRILLLCRIFCVETKIRNGKNAVNRTAYERVEARPKSIAGSRQETDDRAQLNERANKKSKSAGVNEPTMKSKRFEALSDGSESARFSDDSERQVSNPGLVAHCGIKPSLILGKVGG